MRIIDMTDEEALAYASDLYRTEEVVSAFPHLAEQLAEKWPDLWEFIILALRNTDVFLDLLGKHPERCDVLADNLHYSTVTISKVVRFISRHPEYAVKLAKSFSIHEFNACSNEDMMWVLEIIRCCPEQIVEICAAIPKKYIPDDDAESSTRRIVAEYPDRALEIAKAMPNRIEEILEELPRLADKIVAEIPDQAERVVKVFPKKIAEVCEAIPDQIPELVKVFAKHYRGDKQEFVEKLLGKFPKKAAEIAKALAH